MTALCAAFTLPPPEVSPLPALAALGVRLFDPPLFEEEAFAAAKNMAAAFAALFGKYGFVAEGFCGREAPALLCLLTVCMGVVGFDGVAFAAGFGCSVLPLLLLFVTLIVCCFPSLPLGPPPEPKLPSTAPVVRPSCALAGFPAAEAGRDLLAPAPRGVGVEGLDGALP